MPHPPLPGIRRRALRPDRSATPKQLRRAHNRQAWQTRQALNWAHRLLARTDRKLAVLRASVRRALRHIEALQRASRRQGASAPLTGRRIGGRVRELGPVLGREGVRPGSRSAASIRSRRAP